MYMLKMKIIFCMRGYLHSHLHVHLHCKESERACGLDRRKEKSAIIKDPNSDLRYNSAPPGLFTFRRLWGGGGGGGGGGGLSASRPIRIVGGGVGECCPLQGQQLRTRIVSYTLG